MKESLRQLDGASRESRDNDVLTDKEEIIYNLIRQQPMMKRAEIQKHINLEKSQTIGLLNKLRDAGRIIKVGNGPSTGYKVLE